MVKAIKVTWAARVLNLLQRISNEKVTMETVYRSSAHFHIMPI